MRFIHQPDRAVISSSGFIKSHTVEIRQTVQNVEKMSLLSLNVSFPVTVSLLCSDLCCRPYFLTELKEQLLARSSRVDDIERLKIEFNDQKREIKEQNEAELESLRR